MAELKPEYHKVYLGLGSNIGNREENISKAVTGIGQRIGTVLAQSSPFYSKPQGFVSDNDFLDIVIACETTLSPREVLSATQEIEKTLGRKKKSTFDAETNRFNYSDRTIDIDILLYDDLTINEPDLQIPHPRMTKRDFVMVPLKEIWCR